MAKDLSPSLRGPSALLLLALACGEPSEPPAQPTPPALAADGTPAARTAAGGGYGFGEGSVLRVVGERYRQRVAEEGRDIEARLGLAEYLMTKAPPDPFGCLKQYEAILALDPAHQAARAGAAATRLRLGQFRRAAADLRGLSAAAPDNPHLSWLLGTAEHWLGHYDDAIAAYGASLDALPFASPQRLLRQWNLRLAQLAAGHDYPDGLKLSHRIALAVQGDASQVRFVDVGRQAGVAHRARNRGSAWGDFDGDGDLDIFNVGIQTPHALFRNDGASRFTDVAAEARLADPRGGWASVAADVDGDGDLEIYVTRDAWEGGAPNSLYARGADGTWADVAGAAGVDDADDSFTATWGDVDGDGHLDLFVADGVTGSGAADKLFVNGGGLRFADRAAAMGVDGRGKSIGSAFGDYDDDGDLDLYVVDVAGPNHLFRNDAPRGRFVDATAAAGVATPGNGGYVTFFFDADRDGRLDLFVTAMSYFEQFVESQVTGRAAGLNRAHLYHNNGDGTFTDVAVASGLSRSFGSMGAGWGDVDADGLVDVYLCNGGPEMARFEPNILYRNLGERFADVTESAGVGHLGKGHGATFADYDYDGDLDLYAGIGGHYPGDLWANSLYRNEGTANHWLAVALVGDQRNPSAVGARVVLRAGGRRLLEEVASGGGFGSTNSLALEFGLGPHAAPVEELIVRWPDGRVDTRRALAPDQLITLSRNGGRPPDALGPNPSPPPLPPAMPPAATGRLRR